jgi:DNA invertase Pin-like site-specific DNA recombinase
MVDRQPQTHGYGRASTKHQHDSPEVQKVKMRDYAAHNSLGDIRIYIDTAKSGKIPIFERPAGRELLKNLRPGDHVVFPKLDRGFRSLADCVNVLAQFEKMGIKVHVVNLMGGALDLSSPMGRFLVHVLAAFAELERDFISERVKEGLAYKKRSGKRHCNFPGYGFSWAKRKMNGRNEYVKVADPEERNVMRSIVEWRTQDDPLTWKEIEDHLKALGVTSKHRDKQTKQPLPWSQLRIRRAARAEHILRLQEQHWGGTS